MLQEKTLEEIIDEQCSMPTHSFTKFEEKIKEYVSKKCKEQRKLCKKEFNHLGSYHGSVVWDKIMKTNEPKII